MKLSKTDIQFWKSSNTDEIVDKYGISRATVFRTAKSHDIKLIRKKGSGSKPKGDYFQCQHCGSSIWKTPKSEQKYCSRVCMYASSEYHEKLKNVDKSYMQTQKYSLTKSKLTTPEYKRYAGKIHRLSNKIYENNLEILNPNGYNRTLCGVDGGYQLDHIISIKYGFDNNVLPENLAKLDNLRLIPWKDNLLKGSRELGE
jgi:5-methylcytosine-specific restriction endonuclease McrA